MWYVTIDAPCSIASARRPSGRALPGLVELLIGAVVVVVVGTTLNVTDELLVVLVVLGVAVLVVLVVLVGAKVGDDGIGVVVVEVINVVRADVVEVEVDRALVIVDVNAAAVLLATAVAMLVSELVGSIPVVEV